MHATKAVGLWFIFASGILGFCFSNVNGDCSVSCANFNCPCKCHRNEVSCSNRSLISVLKYPMHMDVKVLDLANNRISEISEKDFHQKCLKSLLGLRLSANGLKWLSSRVFESLVHLEMLFVNHNYIDDIAEGAFVGLKDLKRLYLNDNQLKFLPVGVFEPLKANLQLLYLHGNKIEHIDPATLENFKHLTTIDLSRNRITKMNGQLFATMPSLRHVFLTNNPWRCDAGTVCSTIGTFKEMRKGREAKLKVPTIRRFRSRKNFPLVVYEGGIMCASPVQYMGTMAEDLVKVFKCHEVNLTEYFNAISIHVGSRWNERTEHKILNYDEQHDNDENEGSVQLLSPIVVLTLVAAMMTFNVC